MTDLIFTNLIQGTKTGDILFPSLVFGNITFSLNGKVTTGTYEYFGRYNSKRYSRLRERVKCIVDQSFESISNGDCYSLYRYLTQSHRRYARILVNNDSCFNECRFSGDSAFDDINTGYGHVDVISSLKDIDKVWTQEVKVNGQIKSVKLDTILNFYTLYRAAIKTNRPLYFYLVRPALDNKRLDGMLYFASYDVVQLEQLRDISYRLSNELTRRVFDRINKESIKSAVAAIMSRNLSHNLGSHYLYYTKTTLEKLADKSGNLGPDIRGAAKVLSYIQSRMDYLATIVSNDKYPYGSVNFKSQILDELTIDDFSKRHYNIDTAEDFQQSVLQNIKQIDLIRICVNELDKMYRQYDFKNDDAALREKISDSVSSIMEQISSLDKRSAYNRTTNFLLTNLIRSENYSRPDIINHAETVQEGINPLFLFVRIWDGKNYQLFTGSTNPNVYVRESETGIEALAREHQTKEMLSRVNLALPGGTMSCHAFFNILENFIRNSAKYSWIDSKKTELTFTLSLKVDTQSQIVDCIIYDDKHDALIPRNKEGRESTLLKNIQHRLSHMKVLAEDNTIDKENKGLKEMVFSAVWLKANESDLSFADIITMIESASTRKKLSLIRKYAFDVLAVDDRGNPTNDAKANLAIKVSLPLFSHVESLHGKTIHDLIKLHTDVVEIPENSGETLFNDRRYDYVFPRVFKNTHPKHNEIRDEIQLVKNRESERDGIDVYMLKEAIKNNLGDIEQYYLRMAAIDEPGTDFFTTPELQIIFDTHFSTRISKKILLSDYFGVEKESEILQERKGKYAYVDTISGNNFTKTLQGLFTTGLTKDFVFYRSYADKYLSLKIKESALTRITIIDERLFNSVKWDYNLGENDNTIIDIRSTEYELMLKNIRVLNIVEKTRKKNSRIYGHKVDGLPFFTGSQFLATGPYAEYPNASNFLSIHLGLIEKLLKSRALESNKFCGPRGNNPFEEKRITRLMELLTNTFGLYSNDSNSAKLHICIHSGRGNFSKELEGPLKQYPFISLAALENSFNNSKFLLAQLFYNTIFLGKGEINH